MTTGTDGLLGTRGWLDLPATLWAFNGVVDTRRRHLAVLACFDAHPFEPALNAERIGVEAARDAPELADSTTLLSTLDQLTNGWGLLTESRDETATYRTPAEFRLRTRQWQLTRDGQAAIATLDGAVRARAAYASLQPAALDDLVTALDRTAVAATDPADPEQVHSRLTDAIRIHTSLVGNLRTFMQDVNRFLTGVDAADDAVYEAKRAILTYLQQFVLDAERPATAVTAACDRLQALALDRVVGLAVEGAHLAPTVTGEDPRVLATAQLTAQAEGILEWFASDGPRTFDSMLPRGREAILKLLRILELQREQRRRASRLPDDFRALARAVAAAPDDRAASLVVQAATGLRPARHAVDAVPVAPVSTRPAADNPGVEVTVELRRRPRSPGRRRADPPVPDGRVRRQQRQAAMAADLAAQRTRRLRLACPPGTRLSDRPDLDHETFTYLLSLLAAALAAPPRPDGSRQATSTDGALTIVLTPIADGQAMTLTTPDGTFRGPDHWVAIHLTDQAVPA